MGDAARDIHLFTPSREVAVDPDRLCMSSGLVAGPASDYRDRILYTPSSFVPREPWRPLPDDELSRLWEPAAVPEQNSGLAIVRLPPEPVQALMAAYLDLRARRGAGAASQRFDEATGALLSTIRDVCQVRDGAVFNGVASQRDDLPTVTVGTASDIHIGLHLDSWDRLSFDRRHESTNRVSVNIGTTDRFLLFIPCTLRLLRQRLVSSGLWWDEKLAIDQLVTRFLSAFPDEPVYRLRVRPCEAYIAPTENMIHDGSTAGSGGQVHSATYRGHIWFT